MNLESARNLPQFVCARNKGHLSDQQSAHRGAAEHAVSNPSSPVRLTATEAEITKLNSEHKVEDGGVLTPDKRRSRTGDVVHQGKYGTVITKNGFCSGNLINRIPRAFLIAQFSERSVEERRINAVLGRVDEASFP
jgi:hypothetical protein